jgi:predicted TIM-barrel fold metal-dependent hydrolase
MAERHAVEAWAQPVTGRSRQDLPEVVRLLEKSGAARYLDLELTPAQIVAAMDAAGVERLVLSAGCRPGRWLITNDEVAAHVRAFPGRFSGVAAVDQARPVAAVRELDRTSFTIRYTETGHPVPYIDEVALTSPELRIVCGPIGIAGPARLSASNGSTITYMSTRRLICPLFSAGAGAIPAHLWPGQSVVRD